MNDEYLPQQNGNGNGNGNGHKSFVLAQPKSAEQLHRESILEMMPKLRRECSRDPRLKHSVGSKWLFGQISDLSFLYNFGGDGFGKLHASIKDLRRIFGHDESSLAKWRDKLVQAGWIWYLDRWPKSVWGISGVCRQPEVLSPHSDYLKTVAKASGDQPSPSGGVDQNGKTEDLGLKAGILPADQPKASGVLAEETMRTSRILPANQPSPSGHNGPKRPAHQPKPSATSAEILGHTGRILRVKPAEGTGHIQETPIGDRSKGALKGSVPPSNLKVWENKIKDWFPAKLEKLKADLVKSQKESDQTDNAAIADLSLRIEAIDRALYGGKLPAKAPKPQPTRRSSPVKPPRELTEAELLESAQAAIEFGVGLTEGQKAALAKAQNPS
jgi:hypothetical protein